MCETTRLVPFFCTVGSSLLRSRKVRVTLKRIEASELMRACALELDADGWSPVVREGPDV